MRNWVKQLIVLNAKLAVLSDLVSGYGENFLLRRSFDVGIDILRDVKMWAWKDLGMWGAYHASVNVICFDSCVLYSSGVTLCCVHVRGSFPLRKHAKKWSGSAVTAETETWILMSHICYRKHMLPVVFTQWCHVFLQRFSFRILEVSSCVGERFLQWIVSFLIG